MRKVKFITITMRNGETYTYYDCSISFSGSTFFTVKFDNKTGLFHYDDISSVYYEEDQS